MLPVTALRFKYPSTGAVRNDNVVAKSTKKLIPLRKKVIISIVPERSIPSQNQDNQFQFSLSFFLSLGINNSVAGFKTRG